MKGDLGGLLRKNSIARKLASYITGLIIVLGLVVAAIFFRIFYQMVLDNQEAKLELRTANVATTMEDSIIKLQERPELGLKETRRLLSSVVTITEDDVWLVAANGQVEMRNRRKPEGININYIKGQIDGDVRGEKSKLNSSYIGYASVQNLDSSFQEMIKAGFRGEHAFRKDYDSKMGEMMLTASAPVYGSDGKAVAVLLLRTPTHGFSQGIKSGLLLFFWCSLAALVAAMAAAGVFALWFTDPLKKMEKMTERFAHGDLQARCGVSRTDEIGKLAKALDDMAEKNALAKEMQEAFYRNVTHDLKTPIIIIGDAVSIMRQQLVQTNFCKTQDGLKLEAGLERIENNSETLLGRVKSILECARAPYKKDWEVRLESLDLILLHAVQDGVSYAESRHKGVNFKLELSDKDGNMQEFFFEKGGTGEQLFVSLKERLDTEYLDKESLDPEHLEKEHLDKESLEIQGDSLKKTLFMCNREKIIDMLQNFITNAVKVSPAGSDVVISLKDNVISIRDYGSGIGKKELKKIFQVGYTTGSDGNGFGMNSARIFAEMHGVEIELESPVVEGKNMNSTLPETVGEKLTSNEELLAGEELLASGKRAGENLCNVNRLLLKGDGSDSVETEVVKSDYVGKGTKISLILPERDCFEQDYIRLPIEEYMEKYTYFDDDSDCRLLKAEYTDQCDMKKILFAACNSLQDEAEEKHVRISRVIKGNGFNIAGDGEMLERLLKNIIDNAVKYSLPNSAEEEAVVEVVLDSENATITVRDKGPGIAHEALSTGPDGRAAIWQKFYADRHKKFNPYGMGIGLYEADLIGEIHEIFFVVRKWQPDEEYSGTEFVLEFSL